MQKKEKDLIELNIQDIVFAVCFCDFVLLAFTDLSLIILFDLIILFIFIIINKYLPGLEIVEFKKDNDNIEEYKSSLDEKTRIDNKINKLFNNMGIKRNQVKKSNSVILNGLGNKNSPPTLAVQITQNNNSIFESKTEPKILIEQSSEPVNNHFDEVEDETVTNNTNKDTSFLEVPKFIEVPKLFGQADDTENMKKEE